MIPLGLAITESGNLMKNSTSSETGWLRKNVADAVEKVEKWPEVLRQGLDLDAAREFAKAPNSTTHVRRASGISR